MPKHTQQSHFHADHFEFDGDTVKQAPTARGGGHLTNTPLTETTVAGDKYHVQATWANGSAVEMDIDNSSYAFKYTGTADKTLLILMQAVASSDTTDTTAEWEVYVNATATGKITQQVLDKTNKVYGIPLAARVDVKQNELIQFYVSSDKAGAKISMTIMNVEIFEV